MNERKTKGYDAPPIEEKDDLLNRWSFAREIYHMACKTPEDWSVRMGIYGGWGEGKTAVLKFVNTLAQNDNQLVLWFNPWEYTTQEEMWYSFVMLVLNKLKDTGINVRSKFFGLKAKDFSGKTLNKIESISKVIPYGEVGLPILKSFLQTNNKILDKLPKVTKGKRVIVLIDDLDRANPILIPQLLFAVKELLDIPGFAFIMAFDPEVVNQTLQKHNINYGQGKDFLDKIIDIPRWLPKPSDKELLNLLKDESRRLLPFIDFNYINQVYPYLDKNPRKLKQWLRLFIGFENELKRYNKEEINWTVFLLVNIIKIKFPGIFDQIFSDNEIWSDLLTNHWFGEQRNKEQPAYLKRIKEISENSKLGGVEEKELIEIIDAIVKIDRTYNSDSFLSYAYLNERPAIVTWKEFYEVLIVYEKDSKISKLNLLLSQIVNKSDCNENDILIAFLIKAIDYWKWSLDQAAEARPVEETKNYVENALLSLDIIEKICFNKNGFVSDSPFLDVTQFKLIYQTATKWIHFSMPAEVYKPIREKEKQLLIRICNETTSDHIEILFFLQPWMVFRSGVYNQHEEKKLAEELSLILEKRISAQLLEKFKIDNWINSIFVQESHLVEQYILLRKSSYLWSTELRQKFLDLLGNNDTQKAISNNMYQFLSLIETAFLSREVINGITRSEDSILQDKELIIAIWKCALIEEINPRMFTGLENLKSDLKTKTGIDVPEPVWWARIKQIVNERENQNKI